MDVARDIAIIIVALESIIINILMAILVIQIIRLIRLLREEVPIIRSTQETLGTVRGTATFVSDHVVHPVVKVNSYAAGVRRGVRVLFGFRNR
jgi:hypothetical protein